MTKISTSKGDEKKIEYRLADDEVYLLDHYIVALTNQNKTLGLYRPTRKGKKLIHTIEKSKYKLFVYNNRFMGYKLEFSGHSLQVFRDRKPVTQYALKSPKKEGIESLLL